MTAGAPQRLELEALPTRALVVAAGPWDGVLDCGGVLARHAGRGDRVRLVVLSDGDHGARPESGPKPGPGEGDPESGAMAASGLEAEARAAAEALEVRDVVFHHLPAGGLGRRPELVELLGRELEDSGAEVVYGPSPGAPGSDRRAVASALAAALAPGPPRRVLLYAAGAEVAPTVLVDTRAVATQKRQALSRFTTPIGASEAGGAGAGARGLPDAEVFVSLDSAEVLTHLRDARLAQPGTTAVVSTWNKRDDLRANLEALRGQTRPFAELVVVDNASEDGTARMVRERFPEVNLIVMPHAGFGACETFNLGFAASETALTAILDDDVVLPPDWLEKTVARLEREPDTTAIVSTKVIEPGMPPAYRDSEALNTERYMSTFRGCASLARTEALRRAGGYDERLYIYGNERDLTCRLLNLGYRVLQYPEAEAFHKTPFGIKMGRRSLYYHARNAWLAMLKYAPASDLLKMPFLIVGKVLLRGAQEEQSVTDATGTIGIRRAIAETPGAWWVLFKAGCSVLYNVPYCLARREPVRAEDFELPIR